VLLTERVPAAIVSRMANNKHTLNNVFGALSDPTRRAVVMRLCEGEASVGELAKPFDMALPSLMKHVRILENSGLVVSEKTGRVRTCALQTEALEAIEVWLTAQRDIWEQRLDRLETYVEKLKKKETSNVRKRKSK
jgi:DNA-binding transcriptional ArsR family regulator